MTSRAHNPLTDTEIARIAEMHANGSARNDIAKELGRSGATISAHCKKLGLTFDRTDTIAATRARQADLASLRADLEMRYLQRAAELLEQIDQPHVVFNFGGKDNTYEERTLTKPTTGDIRNLMQSASIATTASLKIATSGVGETDNSAVDSWLEFMLGAD